MVELIVHKPIKRLVALIKRLNYCLVVSGFSISSVKVEEVFFRVLCEVNLLSDQRVSTVESVDILLCFSDDSCLKSTHFDNVTLSF